MIIYAWSEKSSEVTGMGSSDYALRILLVIILNVCIIFGKEPLAQCEEGKKQACQVLFRLANGESLVQGPYCACPACNDEWGVDSERSITWIHHERSDWTVQYKFCEPVPLESSQECGPNEVPFIIDSPMKMWHPRIKQTNCKCPNGDYHLSSWKRVGSNWRYTYTCRKELCDNRETCRKRRYSKSGNKQITTSVEFFCQCPIEFQCMTDRRNETSCGTDSSGSFWGANYCTVTRRPAQDRG